MVKHALSLVSCHHGRCKFQSDHLIQFILLFLGLDYQWKLQLFQFSQNIWGWWQWNFNHACLRVSPAHVSGGGGGAGSFTWYNDLQLTGKVSVKVADGWQERLLGAVSCRMHSLCLFVCFSRTNRGVFAFLEDISHCVRINRFTSDVWVKRCTASLQNLNSFKFLLCFHTIPNECDVTHISLSKGQIKTRFQ